jgi:phosphopentomutase
LARAIILVIDSLGIGHTPDAASFGDVSANTFANLAQAFYNEKNKAICIPHLSSLGLVKACEEASNRTFPYIGGEPEKGAYGYANEISSGKDTPSGHWEMAGVPVLFDWDYFTNKNHCFSTDLLEKIYQKTGIHSVLGNKHGSGTNIIVELGEEHINTGAPICYTSADSVFQVAAHEDSFGLDNLYKYCEQIRELLDDEKLNIGRVIARPFIGNNAEDFTRTGNRRDYSVLPPAPTILDKMADKKQGDVISIGKISDIFAHQGISVKIKATGLPDLIDTTIQQIASAKDNSIIFTNLVNFDQDFGHRRDPIGYAEALEYLDKRLPDIYQNMQDDDYLFITADHGCDPTWPGSDHTREYVPQLVYKNAIGSINLGERNTFADLGQTIAELFDLPKMDYGSSYLKNLSK